MRVYDADHIRNVVLAGHQGSGKTALSEAMVYASGGLDRLGSVNEGTTLSDYHPSEKERQMSIFTSMLHAEWRGHKINIFDTPGYPDFVSEVIAPMKVADTALYVMDARAGVQVGTELAWTYGEMTQKPAMFVINHLDHSESDFRLLVEQIKERFGRGATVVQLPGGAGTRTIIDVLRMKELFYPEGEREPEIREIRDEFRDEADELHRTLVEDIAENDESLMELYFEQGELDEDQMREGLRAAMIERQLFPIFVTSATEAIGVSRLMSFIDNVCPSPAAKPAETMEGEMIYANEKADDPVAFVFRTMSEDHVGEYSFVRVYDGTLQSGQDLDNPRTGNSERIGQIYSINGSERDSVQKMVAGDIGALVKLKDTHTNDTLRGSSSTIQIKPIEFPEPRYRMAVRARQDGLEDKLAQGLHQIAAEDPSLVFDHDPLLNQLTLSGQGEMHLQIARGRLQRRSGVEIDFIRPRVSYRETVRKRARASYRHKKQTGGAGQFADISLMIEPLNGEFNPPSDVKVRGEERVTTEWGAEIHFVDAIVGGVIDMRRFFGAIQKGVLDAMAEGPVAGFPVGDVRVVIYDGGMHPVDSNEAAFKTAAFQGFREAFHKAKPVMLEPLHDVTVTTPDDFTGDVIGDLNTRRGRIQGIETDGPFQKIIAQVPEAELFQYSTTLRSLTHGRGIHHARFSHYEAMPANVQEDVVGAVSEDAVPA
ncbi:elongation factor G [Longibacter salinarum]|uniref:Elongation factor G n=1 Tax=Longibacter salinarum TaxID=1850348 RepID=A0A2A8CY21_9BACT|nr:elongation factor G [Longibacter salinarum]PEN13629.1 elongation factor G [Longibacter salinarum]